MYRLFIVISMVSFGLYSAVSCAVEIELYPKHFAIKLGEQIHYTAIGRTGDGKLRFLEQVVPFTFETGDRATLSLDNKDGRFSGRSAGSAEVIVRTQDGAVARFPIRVANEVFRPIGRTALEEVPLIQAPRTVVVVHANRDGFDHTRVAKPGIDRIVGESKAKGDTVIYLMSPQYPSWDTTDREPTYAIESDTGGHTLRLKSEEIVFVGGNFSWCLLECVKSSLLSFVTESDGDLRLVFPLDAIYEGAPGKGYPHSMVTLESLWDSAEDRSAALERIVRPFLEKLRKSVSDGLAAADRSSLAGAADLQAAGVVVEMNGQVVLEHQLDGARRVLRFQFVDRRR